MRYELYLGIQIEGGEFQFKPSSELRGLHSEILQANWPKIVHLLTGRYNKSIICLLKDQSLIFPNHRYVHIAAFCNDFWHKKRQCHNSSAEKQQMKLQKVQ